jgi:hypothetical protein
MPDTKKCLLTNDFMNKTGLITTDNDSVFVLEGYETCGIWDSKTGQVATDAAYPYSAWKITIGYYYSLQQAEEGLNRF